MPRKKAEEPAAVGKKIKKVRTDKKIPLEQMANDTGFSIEDLKKIESGKMTPPVGALLQIARALEIDSGFFLREQESSQRRRARAYTKRTDNYAYTTLTSPGQNKHLMAFRVTVEAMQDHEGVFQHEGEEFVYVLAGTIEVKVGEHVNRLGDGENLHFNSGVRHELRNVGEKTAELLVVIYAP